MPLTPTFTAIVTAHGETPTKMIGNLMYQTHPPDEILCYVSDFPIGKMREHFPNVTFIKAPNREDWGHDKRAQGLWKATSEWVGFFNADDEYDLTYLEKMLSAIDEDRPGAIYCGWSNYPGCGFWLGSSTSGNFIVRRDIGLAAGYTDRHYEADGTFINRVADLCDVYKVNEVLYTHNVEEVT